MNSVDKNNLSLFTLEVIKVNIKTMEQFGNETFTAKIMDYGHEGFVSEATKEGLGENV